MPAPGDKENVVSTSFPTLRWAAAEDAVAEDDDEVVRTDTRAAALERLETLRSFRRAASAGPDADLSDAGQAAWRIVVAQDPELPRDVIRSRLKAEMFRSALGWHSAQLRKLTVRREMQGRPLNPEADEELAKAIAAAEEEELASLIPARALRRVSRSRSARFTYHDDEYARRRPYLEARRAELQVAIERSGRQLDLQIQLAEWKVRDRERSLARFRERGAMPWES